MQLYTIILHPQQYDNFWQLFYNFIGNSLKRNMSSQDVEENDSIAMAKTKKADELSAHRRETVAKTKAPTPRPLKRVDVPVAVAKAVDAVFGADDSSSGEEEEEDPSFAVVTQASSTTSKSLPKKRQKVPAKPTDRATRGKAGSDDVPPVSPPGEEDEGLSNTPPSSPCSSTASSPAAEEEGSDALDNDTKGLFNQRVAKDKADAEKKQAAAAKKRQIKPRAAVKTPGGKNKKVQLATKSRAKK